jgi:hypothetical protein
MPWPRSNQCVAKECQKVCGVAGVVMPLQDYHYARRTVDTYEQWLRRFLRLQHLRHPREMG